MTDKSTRRPVGKPDGRPAGKPFSKTGDKPYGKPGDRSFSKSGDKPYGKPGDRTFSKPGDKPYGKPGDRTFSKPGDKPYGKPGDRPFSKPGDKPYGKPEDRPFSKPGDKPYDKPGDRPFSKPGHKTYGKPGGRPFNKAGDRPYGKTTGKPAYRDEGRGPVREERNVPKSEEFAEEGQDKLEGRNPILEALKAGRTINKILIARGDREGSIRQIAAMAREKGVIVQEVDRSRLDMMSSTRSHQGVIAFTAVRDYVEVDQMLKAAQDKGEAPFLIILDDITDPNNLGSILRTADAAGAHGVIIPKRRAVGLTPAVSKAAAGAVEYVPVARVTNLPQTVDDLKKQGVWVVGTDASGEKAFFESDLKGPIALVIGSEGEGMGRLVREKCDFVVNIPMRGSISSLNAAVAGAIIMYEIMKQRGR